MKDCVLAFESSCDDTAVALVDRYGKVIGQMVVSQVETHNRFGGVIPELASRLHEDVLDQTCRDLLNSCALGPERIYAVAATCGPGLIGPLLVGKSFAEGLAAGWGLPFIGVHHLRGHIASVLLDVKDSMYLKERAKEFFPALVLLVSGGHTQVLSVENGLQAQSLLESQDDAAGECFDKCAKLMGLSYPGGPAIEALASTLKTKEELSLALSLSVSLPKPKSEMGFSFSGLKTAVRNRLQQNPELKKSPSFAWAIQQTIGLSLLQGLESLRTFLSTSGRFKSFVFCGGVSANRMIRQMVNQWAVDQGLRVELAPMAYCTDNAAMVAAAAWVQDPSLVLVDVLPRIPFTEEI